MSALVDALVGDPERAGLAAVKAVALFVTAVVAFRFTERRTLAELAPFDFVAAVAVGAIIGRTATAADASWLTGAAALLALLLAHSVVARLRFRPRFRRLVDPPLEVLITGGTVHRRALRRCGLTDTDLTGVLREHGITDPAEVRLAVFEPKGGVSVLTTGPTPGPATRPAPIDQSPPQQEPEA